MNNYEFKSVDEMLVGMGYNLLREGVSVSPRGQKTLELAPALIQISNPTNAVITNPYRKMNYEFLAMESIWVLSGDNEPWIIEHLNNLNKFTNVVDGKKRLMGAYGPRIRSSFGIDQLRYCVNLLKEKPDTRKAVISIIHPSVDTQGWEDMACTQWIQFLIRDEKLQMHVVMRSNDIWLGAVYDFFLFSMIQHLVANLLKISVGDYYHFAGSFHVYERDIDKLREVMDYPWAKIDPGIPSFSTMDYTSLDQIYEDASYGKLLKSSRELPKNERWLTRLMQAVLNRIDAKEAAKVNEK